MGKPEIYHKVKKVPIYWLYEKPCHAFTAEILAWSKHKETELWAIKGGIFFSRKLPECDSRRQYGKSISTCAIYEKVIYIFFKSKFFEKGGVTEP